MNIYEKALALHARNKGKLSVESKVEIDSEEDLSLAYSPGVAEPCRKIADDSKKIFDYTSRGNMIAVVSSGTAVLGLGNIGAGASLPVMEGKAVLFKKFAGLDAFPICLDTEDPDRIVETVKLLSPVFSGVNLEDIAAPDCFYIEKRLKKETEMAIFHDDQHGTAIVILAGLYNATKVTSKDLTACKIVINGAGASATATANLLIQKGIERENLIICDSRGIIHSCREDGMNEAKEKLAAKTNPKNIAGSLNKAVKNADIFIGLSVGGVLDRAMIDKMADDPIIFALANPEPEIDPSVAKKAGASVVATGRSDHPNQINNVLAFPGVMRGAISVRSSEINQEMKLSAARNLAELVKSPSPDKIIPPPLRRGVTGEVALAVARTAMEEGCAGEARDDRELREKFSRQTY